MYDMNLYRLTSVSFETTKSEYYLTYNEQQILGMYILYIYAIEVFTACLYMLYTKLL